MAAYIRPLGSVMGHFNNATEDFTAGATIANGDFLQFNSSGQVVPATTGRIIGTAQSSVASSATVKVLIEPFVKYLVQASSALNANTVGQYYNLTGATGAQQINQGTASTTTGQFALLRVNPAIDPVRTDTTWNIVTPVQNFLAIS